MEIFGVCSAFDTFSLRKPALMMINNEILLEIHFSLKFNGSIEVKASKRDCFVA